MGRALFLPQSNVPDFGDFPCEALSFLTNGRGWEGKMKGVEEGVELGTGIGL